MINWQENLAYNVQQTKPSGIRRFFDIASTMYDVISLGIGEPDFITPWSIRESCVYGLERGYTAYTSNKGLFELREAITQMFARDFNINYDPNNEIIITVGVSEAVDIAMRSILNPGDEILIPEPCYVSYAACATLAGAKPIAVPTKSENEFKVTAEDLAQHITSKTKALLIGYPNNPTGTILEYDELLAIANFAKKHNLIVISDEIYGDLTYGDKKHICFSSLPDMKDYSIILNGFSKAYAMTGWRLGYALAPKPVIDAMNKIHQYTMICAPITAQIAGLEAIRNGQKHMKKMVAEYDRRRRLIYEGFTSMGLNCFEPKGAFYIFPNISNTGLTSEEFAEQLLLKQHVAVVPGTAFGQCGEGFIRASYATSVDNISEALKRIQKFLNTL